MSTHTDRTNRGWLITVRDGLKLHVTHWPAPRATARPVLCLPGLTRNGRDFQDVAIALSTGETPRDVFALDARGRGLSDYDPDWKNYTVPTETQDVIDVMTALGLHNASIIGTSRGGLQAMVLAALQPGLIGAVVLNDIGPVIERRGLLRIAGYVGRMPLPVSWDDASRMVGDVSRKAFPAFADGVDGANEVWARVARAWYNERDGRPAPGYDPNLGRSLSPTDAAPPPLWAQFDALKHASVLVVRGETSDLLSAETVTAMKARHPNCASLTVAGQGHAPLLMDPHSIKAISAFFDASCARRSVAGETY
jgi:pimeloyl-ACP methyl ester carboxylesterase